MALFGSKKNTEKTTEAKAPVKKAAKKAAPKAVKTAPTKAVAAPKKAGAHTVSYAHVLSRPRITEKAARIAEGSNAYTFEIATASSKHDVMKAIQDAYHVTAEKVTITRLPAKHKIIRGKWGVKAGVKKATVFLKKGDKIEFV